MKVRALVVFALALATSIRAIAQTTCSKQQYTNTLICTLPQLFTPVGLTLPNPGHNAHFAGTSESQLALPVNQGTGQALAILPLGSSGSGTTWTLDSEGHAIPASEDSLGPILTERANVIGKKAIGLGVAYQYYDFSHLDGIRLSSFPAVLTHEGWTTDTTKVPITAFMQDYVQTTNEVHLELNQAVIYGVFGVSKYMDVSLEVPIQAAHLRVFSTADIIRTQPCELNATCAKFVTDPTTNQQVNLAEQGEFHYFSGYSSTMSGTQLTETIDPTQIRTSTHLTFPNTNYSIQMAQTRNEDGSPGGPLNLPARASLPETDAKGIGDITLRGKYEIIHHEKLFGSVGLGLRFPSGDAKNFLGTGAVGVIPFGALTYKARLSPHVRFGYEWNGKSILAGDPSGVIGATSASLPAAWLYSGGADYRATKWLTLDADLIGERVLDVRRLSLGSYTLLPPTTGQTPTEADRAPVRSIVVSIGTSGYSSDSIAVGGKIRLKKELVLIGNATMRIDNGGLRADVVPLIGLSYAF